MPLDEIREHKAFYHLLSTTTSVQRIGLLKTITSVQFRGLLEIVTNILHGIVILSSESIAKLKRYSDVLRWWARKNVSKANKSESMKLHQRLIPLFLKEAMERIFDE
jgi:hypothetical protein